MRGQSDLWTPSSGWTKASSSVRRTALRAEVRSEVRDAGAQEFAAQQAAYDPYGSFDRSILVYLLGVSKPSHGGEPCFGRQCFVGPYRVPHQDGPSLSAA